MRQIHTQKTFEESVSAEVLHRMRNENPDFSIVNMPLLKQYLRQRLEEEGISQYRLSEMTGVSRSALTTGFTHGGPISLSRLERILWIVDGCREKWDTYSRGHEGV